MIYFSVNTSEEIRDVLFAGTDMVEPCLQHVRGFDRSNGHPSFDFVDNPEDDATGQFDVLGVLRTMLIVSDSARRTIDTVVPPTEVEWLPATYKGERWWIMHGLTRLDAIDEQRSDIRRGAKSGRVMRVERLCLIEAKCEGHSLFRLAGGLERWSYVVSAEFVDAWDRAGLTGFDFVPLCDD